MNTNPDNMQFPFAKEALEGLDTQVSQDWNREQLDAMHMQFVAHWRQSMSTLVPAEIKILAGDMELKTYEAFVLEAPSFADIQSHSPADPQARAATLFPQAHLSQRCGAACPICHPFQLARIEGRPVSAQTCTRLANAQRLG